MSSSSGRYSHHEQIVISPLAPVLSAGGAVKNEANINKRRGSGAKLAVDVAIEAFSSVDLPNGALGGTDIDTSTSSSIPATTFPPQVLDLVREHGLKRLAVQVSSSSSSSSSSLSSAATSSTHSTGPVGTSIQAEFHIHDDQTNVNSINVDDKIKSLLRSLVGSRLICAPLDSISISKNQHHSYPLQRQYHSSSSDDGTGIKTASYQIVLPATAGHFCTEGIGSFRNNLLPCGDRAGFLASSSSPSLSDMLLGSASNSRRGSRNGLRIDIATNGDGCFGRRSGGNNNDGQCMLSLHQGISYGAQVDATIKTGNDGMDRYTASFSLGDVLDDNTSSSSSSSSSLNYCPLADTSNIITNLSPSVRRVRFVHPFQGGNIKNSEKGGFEYELESSGSGKAESNDGRVVHDVHPLVDESGPISLSKKWMAIEMEPFSVGTDSLMSVDRTIEMPKGVANHGNFRTVYRNEATMRLIEDDVNDPATVLVETMDVYPKFIKPLLQSLSVRLYQGDEAGSAKFVPDKATRFVEILPANNCPDQDGRFQLTSSNDGSLSLQLSVVLPPDSSLWISLKYTPRFLSFEHYPSDPNRGVDVLPSYGDFRLISGETSVGSVCPSPINSFNHTMIGFSSLDARIRLYTASSIVMPPVPDMSMPFNVISLTCTLYAFIIGSMINFLVRKSSQRITDAYKGVKEKSKMAKLKEKLKKKLRLFQRRNKVDFVSMEGNVEATSKEENKRK